MVQVKVGEYNFDTVGETADKLHAVKRIVVHEHYDPVSAMVTQ